MTTEQWPSNVNAKGILPYTPEEAAAYVVDENDIGTPNARSRSTGLRKFHTFDLEFTKSEWAFLKEWVRFNLVNATQPFSFPHPETGEVVTMRFTIESGNWYSNLKWTFDYVRVTVKMEELPNG